MYNRNSIINIKNQKSKQMAKKEVKKVKSYTLNKFCVNKITSTKKRYKDKSNSAALERIIEQSGV